MPIQGFKDWKEERAKKAKSRQKGDSRKKMSDYMGKFKAKMGDLKHKLSQPPQQRFGTSPLQQAMAQQQQGAMTPQAQEMMNYYANQDPAEMNRQAQLMDSGIHGDYGVNRQASPYYTDATTNLLAGDEQGPPDQIGSPDATVGTSVAKGDIPAVEQRLLLDRMMKDPSKLNAEGIKSMQTTLNSLGFKDSDGNMLDVDGKMGKLTASAMENYRGQLGQGVPENNEPLAGQPVVSGVQRAGKYAQSYEADGVSPIDKYNPYQMGVESEWETAKRDVHEYGGKGGMDYGYQNIQNTIGNPDNDPVMWGMDEFTNPLQSLQYDGDNEVPYRDYIGPRPPR
jgi:hypothetical protein